MGSCAFYQVLVIQRNRKFGNNQVITLVNILQAILVKDTGEEHMRCAVESKNSHFELATKVKITFYNEFA